LYQVGPWAEGPILTKATFDSSNFDYGSDPGLIFIFLLKTKKSIGPFWASRQAPIFQNSRLSVALVSTIRNCFFIMNYF
jgi:hypothetical protein